MRFQTLYAKLFPLVSKYFWWLVVLVLVTRTLILGAGLGTLDYYHFAQNPFTTRTDLSARNYWQESILLPIFTFVTHLNSELAYYLFCLGVVYAAYIVFAGFAFRRFHPVAALGMTMLLVGHSTGTILFSWLGLPDPLTFFFLVLILFVYNPYIIFGIAVLGSLNHPITIISVLSVLLLRTLSKNEDVNWRHLGSAVLGSVVGLGIVRFYLWYFNIQLFSRLDYIQSHRWEFWVRNNSSELATTLFSFHSLFWFVLIVCVAICFRLDRRYAITWILLALFYYIITFFTVDTTRVYALLAWGAAFHCLMHTYELYQSAHPNSKAPPVILFATGAISVLAPGFFVWKSVVYSSPFKGFFERIIVPTWYRFLQKGR